MVMKYWTWRNPRDRAFAAWIRRFIPSNSPLLIFVVNHRTPPVPMPLHRLCERDHRLHPAVRRPVIPAPQQRFALLRRTSIDIQKHPFQMMRLVGF